MTICDFCGKELTASALRRHVMTVHTGEVNKTCQICNKGFANVSNYHYHMAHHGNERNFMCSECPKAYKTKVDLLQHERVHTNLKGRFECDKCLKNFNTKEKYVIHMKSHLPKGPQTCEICNKTFVNLKMHIKTVHENVRSYICPHCEKSFAKKSGLDRHVTTVHEKLKNFPCPLCNRAFGEKAQLTKHVAIHANPANTLDQPDKKYKCKECPRSFAEKDWLKRHEVTVHEKLRNFFCDMCDKAYPFKYMLNKHVRASHLKIKVKRKKRAAQDPTIIEKFMENGLKSIMFSDPSDSDRSDNDATEQVFINTAKNESDDKSTVKNDPDEFQSLLEAATANDIMLNTDCLASPVHEITSVFVKQEVKDTFESEVNVKMELDDFDNISAGSPGFHDYSNPASPLVESIKPELTLLDIVDPPLPLPVAKQFVQEKKSNLVISEVHTLSAPIQILSAPIQTLSAPIQTRSTSVLTRSAQVKTRSAQVEIPSEMLTSCDIMNPEKQEFYLDANGKLTKAKPKPKTVTIIEGPQKEFVCEAPGCEKSYHTRNEREQHFHGCHPELSNPVERGKRTCSICMKFFSKVQHLKAHVDAEHNKLESTCQHCQKVYSIKFSLGLHIKRKHTNLCPNCPQIFVTKEELKIHWDIDHKGMEFPFLRNGEVSCDICNKIFVSKDTLVRHKLVVHENMNKKIKRVVERPCDICKEMIKVGYQTKKHMRDIHKNGEIMKRKCLLCNSEFDLYEDFKTHVETHSEFSICLLCGDYFPDELKRFTHTSMVHKRNKYSTLAKNISCDICGHRTANKAVMDHHIRKHSKSENFYICDVCGKSYKFLPPFLYHKRTHLAKMDYSCDYCDKKYRTKTEYITHTRIHTGERPFKCEICGKGFHSKIGLKTHQIVHSVERKTYECKMCNISFQNNVQRKSHIEQMHPELRTLYCVFCHRLFRYDYSLRMHIESRHPGEDPNDAPAPPDHLLHPRFHHNSQKI